LGSEPSLLASFWTGKVGVVAKNEQTLTNLHTKNVIKVTIFPSSSATRRVVYANSQLICSATGSFDLAPGGELSAAVALALQGVTGVEMHAEKKADASFEDHQRTGMTSGETTAAQYFTVDLDHCLIACAVVYCL
jgi:hypothetical protein